MHVVRHPADLEGLQFVLPGDAAKKRPKSLAQLRRDQRPPVFGAEYAVIIRTDVRHDIIQPSLRDLCNVIIAPQR